MLSRREQGYIQEWKLLICSEDVRGGGMHGKPKECLPRRLNVTTLTNFC